MLSRRTFLAHTGAGALVPVLGFSPGRTSDLGKEYLVKGLTGMGRAPERNGWFQAHWGAAVLASYYLVRENELDERTTAAVKVQTDALIRKYGRYFKPLPKEEADEKRLDAVAAALEKPIEGHRASGHAATFAALSLRALKDMPELATKTITGGLIKISERIGRKKAAADTAYNRDNPLPDYKDRDAVAECAFDCIQRYDGIRFPAKGEKGPGRPNFTHQITFTDALVQLDRMGFAKLAKRGHDAHKIYINSAPSSKVKRDYKPKVSSTVKTLLSSEFWEDKTHTKNWAGDFDIDDNRAGDWLAGHVFKVTYSYCRLRRRIKDQDKIRKCDQLVLERYIGRLSGHE